MDENGFDVFKATDRERINEALRMIDGWEKEEKEAADWDYEANEMDQYVNLPEHTRKLLDCLGMLQGTLNTYEVKDDREKLEAIDKVVGISLNNPAWRSPNEVAKMVLNVRDILSGKKS